MSITKNIQSAGVFDRLIDRSFVADGSGGVVGAIVIASNRGPTEVTTVTSAKQFTQLYGFPSRDYPSLYAALRYLHQASILSVYRAIVDATAATVVLQNSGLTADLLTVNAANPGTWGNNIVVTFNELTNVEPAGTFELIVTYDGNEVERFEVSRDTEAKDGFGRTLYIEDVVNNQSTYIQVVDGTDAETYDFAATLTLIGGTNDTTAPTSVQLSTAWDEFANDESVEAQILINGGWADEVVQNKMITIAGGRRDCRAILDIPEATTSTADMIAYRDSLAANTHLAGLYGVWIKAYDQYNDREVNVPPSGDVAAAIARKFRLGEPWDAHAGMQYGIIPNAQGVVRILSRGDMDLLYANGINPVTTINGTAAVIWGQKTLQRARSALDRQNVVDNYLWISETLVQALQPFVFQPLTDFAANNAVFVVEQFLASVEARGGLFAKGNNPAFFVEKELDPDQNRLTIRPFISPTRSGEFIDLPIVVTSSGIQA